MSELSGDELARRILELTPEPDPSAEPGDVLDAIEPILAARASLLAITGEVRSKASPALAQAVEARDAAWRSALESARDRLGQLRRDAGKVSAYAVSDDCRRR